MINQFDWAEKWALYRPNEIAFRACDSGETLTFEQLDQKGNGLVQYLRHTFGIRKGDRVAVLAEFCLEYLLLFVAAQKTGIILVPLNYRLADEEINYYLNDAAPQLILFEEKYRTRLDSCLKDNASVQARNVTSIVHVLAQIEKLNKTPEIVERVVEDDPIFILYTSGSTGFPKGVIYTHKMLFWNSINTAISLKIGTTSRTVNCMPPYHTGGWNVLTTPFFHHGGYSCHLRSFDASIVLKLIEDENATIFMGIPTMLKMMSDLPEFDSADLTSLHYVIVGGEPMSISLIEKWHAKGVCLRQGYGMTEVGPNLTSLHQDDAMTKIGSIGRPNFYVETRIVDEFDVACPAGEPGELLLRGPMVTPGYWKNDEATKQALRGGWFHTGDRVRVDAEGYLYVVDRIKNMYISGGENVYPAEVERVLEQHPFIDEATVVGMPHDKWGESGCAFIKTNAVVQLSEVVTHCKSQLANYKVPKQIIIIDEFPKNSTGKIDRKALIRMAKKGNCV